jgi:hypothetical protein
VPGREPPRRLARVRPSLACLAASIALATAGRALADPPADGAGLPVAFGADQVRLDPKAQALDVAGHVHVDEPPFHLTSDELRLRRVPIGVALEGDGKVAFCPCFGSPLAVRFQGATVAPPHDLVLRDPVLEVFGVPVAWAPVMWLRSAGRVGLLAPDVEWRGADGLFLGEGIHVPWRDGDLVRGLDVRAGGYVDGGAAAEVRLRTAIAETRAGWDWWRGDAGLTLAANGSTAIVDGGGPESLAWELEALRGGRAVRATSDVGAAAFPFDRARGEAAWQADGWTFASGVRVLAARGGSLLDFGSGGPFLEARRDGSLGDVGAYDMTVEGGAVDGAGLGATSFARGEGGAAVTALAGATATTFALRATGAAAHDGGGTGLDGAAEARLSATAPFERPYPSVDADDPWIHRVAPGFTAAALLDGANGPLLVPAARGATVPNGAAWVAAADFATALGRWGSTDAAEASATGGVVGDRDRTVPVVRARASAGGRWLGLAADFARVFDGTSAGGGGAFIGRLRVGPARSLHLSAHVAERDGVDPVVARAIVDAPLEPSSGFLSAPGWTGGASAGVPLGPRVTLRGGADVDFDARELVAALGAVELHDPCGCVVLRASAAHRIGRDGVDVWLSVDLPRP